MISTRRIGTGVATTTRMNVYSVPVTLHTQMGRTVDSTESYTDGGGPREGPQGSTTERRGREKRKRRETFGEGRGSASRDRVGVEKILGERSPGIFTKVRRQIIEL